MLIKGLQGRLITLRNLLQPFFGLILSLIFLVAYFITDIEIFAGLASFNALIEKGHSIIVIEHNIDLIK